jgi:hypothetical protein
MKLFIPTIGQILQLEKEWKVTLQQESRNYAMIQKHGKSITFPVGTQFAVDRIYIRQGASDYDSVTFRTVTEPKGRFWVKLAKANEIECAYLKSVRERHQILEDGEVIIDTTSAKNVCAQLRSDYRSNFRDMFGAEVYPQMPNWIVKPKFDKSYLNDTDFATDVETKTHIPNIQAKDSSKYPITEWVKDKNREAGQTRYYSWGLASLSPTRDNSYKNPSHYWNIDPEKARTAFLREFHQTLKKIKGVKTDEELLALLPAPFEYRIKKEKI